MTKPQAKALRKTTSRPRATSLKTKVVDRATEYARSVVDKKVVAGPYVRAACQRHLKDIESATARGLLWDITAAEEAINFFGDVLRLNGEGFEGAAYEPLDWQYFIIGSLFGWKIKDTDARRFHFAYIETAKGSGKSPLAAGIGLKGLCADRTDRAEIYAAATTRDQAMVLFRDAVAMVRYSAELAKRCILSGPIGREYNIAYHERMSFFRPLSSEEAEKSGKRPHITLVDELHEHPNAVLIEMANAGLKNRKNGLVLAITNSGHDKETVCGRYHHAAIKVAQAEVENDAFFSYVCAHDEGDDPFNDETCWVKTNPSLSAGLPGLTYLRNEVAAARNMPAKEAQVRRLNFCEWTEADTPAISRHTWLRAGREYDLEKFKGRRAYGGLDLSQTTDLTSFVLNIEPLAQEEPWHCFAWFWLPEDGLAAKDDFDRAPYLLWRKQGFLSTTPGGAVDKSFVLEKINKTCSHFNVQAIAYDRFGYEPLQTLMNEKGIRLPMVPFGQGFASMGPAWATFEERLICGKQAHNSNPILTWNVANTVTVADPAGNRKPAKNKSTGRIDGLVALVMANGISLTAEKAINMDDVLNSVIKL